MQKTLAGSAEMFFLDGNDKVQFSQALVDRMVKAGYLQSPPVHLGAPEGFPWLSIPAGNGIICREHGTSAGKYDATPREQLVHLGVNDPAILDQVRAGPPAPFVRPPSRDEIAMRRIGVVAGILVLAWVVAPLMRRRETRSDENHDFATPEPSPGGASDGREA